MGNKLIRGTHKGTESHSFDRTGNPLIFRRCKFDTRLFVQWAGLTGLPIPNIGAMKSRKGTQMIVRKSLVSLAAAGLIFGSTAAAAAPVAADRAASDVTVSDEMGGIGTFGLLLGLLIVAGVVAIIVSDDEEDAPTSP